jgi:hypothetical protein
VDEHSGDPRNNYLARMDWAANSSQLTIQQLNRRQTQNTMWIAEAASGTAKPLFVERDSAWIDIYDDHTGWGPGPSLHWLEDKSAFVYLSERDGWRHAWLVSRDGKMRLITDGKYDVMNVSKSDTKGGWLYFYASPENATQMYLWRIKLSGGAPERLTPATQSGTHEYDIGPLRVSPFTRVRRGARCPSSTWCGCRRTEQRACSSTITAQDEARRTHEAADRIHAESTSATAPSWTRGSCGRRTSIRRRSIRCCSTSTASRGIRLSSTRMAARGICGI